MKEVIERLKNMETTMHGINNLLSEELEKTNKLLNGECRTISDVLKSAEALHPYKVPGLPESYSTYCEAWQDCIDYIREQMTEGVK